MPTTIRQAYDALRLQATERRRSRFDGKLLITVQDAHCTRAVGSHDVALALQQGLQRSRGGVELIVAGCDGTCYLAPRVALTDPAGGTSWLNKVTPSQAHEIAADPASARPTPEDAGRFWSAQRRSVLAGCGSIDPESVEEYLARGGYEGLAQALAMTPEQVVDVVLDAGLRGRGGAYFPTGRKWQSARNASAEPRYLVVNAEEGEPGVFKDRHLMEGDPHRLLEGVAIAAYAVGAAKAYLYINAEAGLSAERVQHAVDAARELGLLGPSVLGSEQALEIEVRRGAGGYVCGEETTLLNTIEGQRRVPRLRPPFPTEAGLFGRPTVINNAETLSNLPNILANGAESFSSVGEGATGTKLVSLSGAVQRPGLIEVPFGVSLRHIIYDIGGGPRPGKRIVGVVAGGPSGGLLPEAMLDIAIAPGSLHETGAVLGSGGVLVFDDTIPVAEIVRQLAQYNADESCGKCTPCREGTVRMVELLDTISDGGDNRDALAKLRGLAEVVAEASLCGLGQMAGGPIVSALHFFGSDIAGIDGTEALAPPGLS